MTDEIFFSRQPRGVDGVGERDAIHIAMTLDDGSVQPQQDRAVVGTMIEAVFERLENRRSDQRGE